MSQNLLSAAVVIGALRVKEIVVKFNVDMIAKRSLTCRKIWPPGPEVIKLEYSLKLKIKRNDWLHADTCPQAANHCTLF